MVFTQVTSLEGSCNWPRCSSLSERPLGPIPAQGRKGNLAKLEIASWKRGHACRPFRIVLHLDIRARWIAIRFLFRK